MAQQHRSRPVMRGSGNAQRKMLIVNGVEFIDENGGGPGVRLRKRQRAKQSK